MTDPPGWFVDALGSLSPEQFRAFVGDLWAARGRDVRSHGRLFVVDTARDRMIRPLAAGERGPVRPGVDTVIRAERVESRTDRGRDSLGPEVLYDLFRFAIDENDAERLQRRYFRASAGAEADDRSTGDWGQPTATARRADEPRRVNPPPASFRRDFLVAAGAFAVGIASVVGLGREGTDDRSAGPNRTASTPAGARTVRPFPPGVSVDGVTDVDRLVDAHTGRLADSSYTTAATRTVHGVGGDLRSTLGLRVELGTDRTFLADLATGGPSGRLLFGERPASAQLWSPDDRLFRRLTVDGTTEYGEFAVGAGVGGAYYWANVFAFGGLWVSTGEFLRWALGGTDLSVAAAERPNAPVVVFATDADLPAVPAGPPDRGTIALESLVGSITNAGLVRSLHLGLGRSDGEQRQVSWTIDYRYLGETAVERPAWLDRFLIDDLLI